MVVTISVTIVGSVRVPVTGLSLCSGTLGGLGLYELGDAQSTARKRQVLDGDQLLDCLLKLLFLPRLGRQDASKVCGGGLGRLQQRPVFAGHPQQVVAHGARKEWQQTVLDALGNVELSPGLTLELHLSNPSLRQRMPCCKIDVSTSRRVASRSPSSFRT